MCVGKHGATVDSEGARYKVRWAHVLGHRERLMPAYEVVDRGEDGAIVRDDEGKTAFLADYEDPEKEPRKTEWDRLGKAIKGDPDIRKSEGSSMILFLKAGTVANRPGLHLETVTDKAGHQTKRWKRGVEAPKQERPRKAEDPEQERKPRQAPQDTQDGEKAAGDRPGVGSKVKFETTEYAGEGEIVGRGKDGATVKDADGNTHSVYWHEMQKPEPAKPDYAPREEKEEDKEYAKRVVDKGDAPEHLPEEHDRYFNTEGSTKIPIANLYSTKSDAENAQGGDNGPKRMLAAYHGVLGKRDPIKVMPHAEQEGKYEVVDGNGTLTSAKKMGWEHLPAEVVSREEGARIMAEEKAKDHAKELAGTVLKSLDTSGLTEDARQPVGEKDEEQLFQKSGEALAHLKSWLDEGDGICDKLGHETMTKAPEDLQEEDWNEPGGMLFIAPLKGKTRARQKVHDDYKGDWSQLLDVVRSTIAVDRLDELHGLVEKLKEGGMELSKLPKDRFTKPTREGYRDILLNITFPNGVIGELQLHVKDILAVKEEGHHHYEITRTLKGQYDKKPVEEWPDADQETFWAAVNVQKKIYRGAWKKVVTGVSKPLLKAVPKPIILIERRAT